MPTPEDVDARPTLSPSLPQTTTSISFSDTGANPKALETHVSRGRSNSTSCNNKTHVDKAFGGSAFPLFRHLPSELRVMVWKFATPECGVVVVFYDVKTDCMKIPSRALHSLMHVCRESRLIYLDRFQDMIRCRPHFEPYGPCNHPRSRYARVNHTLKYFYMVNLKYWRNNPALLRQVRNVIVSSKDEDLSNLLHYYLKYWSSVLQQLWVWFSNKPELCPRTTTLLKYYDHRHLCDIQPHSYTPSRQKRRYNAWKELCPNCRWQTDLFGYPDSTIGEFRLMLDPNLSETPSKQDILESKNPAVVWVRVTGSG
ncbi:hypothetical protein F4679DRAFT_555008 [Xylaria curta]|nr:hypothetical protein F4679DRAFT_555008 [Xylaria curta]